MPHRAGDFALLLHMGLPKRRAAQFAVWAGASAVLGWLLVAFLRKPVHASWLLTVSAATFLYIALVDLLPELHITRHGRRLWWQIFCLGAGAALMAALTQLPGE
jgi:zinc and cadmium transporter